MSEARPFQSKKRFHDIIKYLNPFANSITVKTKIDEAFDDKKNEAAIKEKVGRA
jgi:hypothetical protein